MKDRKLMIMALSLMLCLTVSVGFALAYFTDYEDARGGAVVRLSGRTEVEEHFDGNNKVVSVSNTGEVDMVVRVMAYGENLKYSPTAAGDWVQGEDANVWYYTKVLKPGESTSEMTIEVSGRVEPDDAVDFEVVVAHESARVTYNHDANGNMTVAAPDGWAGFPAIAAAE